MECGLVPQPQTPLHLPLFHRWESIRVIGARSSCLRRLPIFPLQQNLGADNKSIDCASARSGEGSSTSSTSALCTQQEHPFPPSPSRGNALWRPLLGHSCLAALCSLVFFTGRSLGPETSLTAAPSSVCRG